ncbi:CTD nuclear envelope phosphatase 1 homolog isoform X2 [Harmonia axyridis]|uniref:CTD nuclear envelope phosphatase 1 homolog isoform X2 n=1 Tax=Harmonia axyridis TaxID=115357 RepID=UPI001E27692D|nr:CTD nuclear envelope phosphatase 1 homolog isoform X2 [Harmonia axyridis]
MWKQLQMGIRAFMLIASRVWTCLCFMLKKQARAIIQHQSVKYELYPLSPLSRHRLSIVKRKTLVLDLDETLIHSHHDGVIRQTVRPGTPPDFVLKVVIDRHPVRFFVHKRPHVDFFLDIVSQWYELVVFTASMEIYGAAVADKLDNGRGILRRRFYRQHCTPDLGSYTKDLSAICNDLSSVFILDNSPGAYRAYPDNAIPIKSWFSDPYDVALLNLLPVLDALRFTADVRSVLSRNLHLHRLCRIKNDTPYVHPLCKIQRNDSSATDLTAQFNDKQQIAQQNEITFENIVTQVQEYETDNSNGSKVNNRVSQRSCN